MPSPHPHQVGRGYRSGAGQGGSSRSHRTHRVHLRRCPRTGAQLPARMGPGRHHEPLLQTSSGSTDQRRERRRGRTVDRQRPRYTGTVPHHGNQSPQGHRHRMENHSKIHRPSLINAFGICGPQTSKILSLQQFQNQEI